MTLEDKKFYIAELVLILEFLHKNGIAHRDVKPENLMLGPDNHLRIIDFGTAMFFDIPTANQAFITRAKEMVKKIKEKFAERSEMAQKVASKQNEDLANKIEDLEDQLYELESRPNLM